MNEQEKKDVQELIEAWYHASKVMMWEMSTDFDTDSLRLAKRKKLWESKFGLDSSQS